MARSTGTRQVQTPDRERGGDATDSFTWRRSDERGHGRGFDDTRDLDELGWSRRGSDGGWSGPDGVAYRDADVL